MRTSCFSVMLDHQYKQLHKLGNPKKLPTQHTFGVEYEVDGNVAVVFDPSWPVIDIRNLSADLYSRPIGASEIMNMFDEANLAPNFRSAWFEMSDNPLVGCLYRALHRSEFRKARHVTGDIITACKNRIMELLSTGQRVGSLEDELQWAEGLAIRIDEAPKEAEWLLQTKLYLATPDGLASWMGGIQFWIKKSGECIWWVDYQTGFLRTWWGQEAKNEKVTEALGEDGALTLWLADATTPIVKATDLLNTKNVTVAERPVPEKVRKKREKSGKPNIIYKRLVVRMKKNDVRWLYSNRKSTEEERRRHHVIGHFKTYTKERPLFGKYTGRFFWSPQWRGLEEVGKVVKVYDLKPYEGNNEANTT